MTDYDRDRGPYTPPAKYNPEPSMEVIGRFYDLNGPYYPFEDVWDMCIRDRISDDLARGRSGLDVGLLYGIMEYMNAKLCYK